MTYEPREVGAALARELEQGIDQVLRDPAAEKSFPIQLGIAQIRRVIRALKVDAPPRVAPLRKLAIVGRYEDSQALREQRAESVYLNREPEPDPTCLAQQPEVDDAG